MATPPQALTDKLQELRQFVGSLAGPDTEAPARTVFWPMKARMIGEATPPPVAPRPQQERRPEMPPELRQQEHRPDPKLPSWRTDKQLLDVAAQIATAEAQHTLLDRQIRDAENELAQAEAALYAVRHPSAGEPIRTAGELVAATKRAAEARSVLERLQEQQLNNGTGLAELYAARLALETEIKPRVRDELAALKRTKRAALIKAAKTFLELNAEMRRIDVQVATEFPGIEAGPGPSHFRMPERGGMRSFAWAPGRYLTAERFREWVAWIEGED